MNARRISGGDIANCLLNSRGWVFFLAVGVFLFGFGAVLPGEAQVASALMRAGDPLPAAGAGHSVTTLNNTAVNHVGGFAVSLNSSDGVTTLSHIWGHATGGAGAIMRTETTVGTFVQDSFESFYGMSDAGVLAYSSSGTNNGTPGIDSVWVDDIAVAVEETPVVALPGQFWSFGSRPSLSADGVPHWIGGITATQGGSTENRVLATTMGGTIVLMGGDTPTGLPSPIDVGASNLSFDYRFSGLSNHYIIEVVMNTGNSSTDGAVVIDDAGLVLDSVLVQEGNGIPASVGGLAGENWDNFDFMGITENGDWFFSGDSDGASATDEMIVKNGVILVREGDILDGETLSGSIEGASMNEDGDVGFIWDVQGGTLEALYLNERLILTEGDEIDWTGDGVVDTGYQLDNFTGTSVLTIGDRDGSDDVDVFFTADVLDPAGAQLEGFFRVSVTSVPVELFSFTIE